MDFLTTFPKDSVCSVCGKDFQESHHVYAMLDTTLYVHPTSTTDKAGIKHEQGDLSIDLNWTAQFLIHYTCFIRLLALRAKIASLLQ